MKGRFGTKSIICPLHKKSEVELFLPTDERRLTNAAGLAGVSLGTGTEELVGLCVHARSTVNARLVAAAVVQICKQKVFLC